MTSPAGEGEGVLTGGEGGGEVGVVVMAYGTPASPEEIPAFYTDVRRGRPPSEEQLADLERRYQAVGGVSQLTARTLEQVAGIQSALESLAPGRYRCRYGSKHATPRIEEAVDAVADEGVSALVGIVLAPHYSAGSVGQYVARAAERAETRGLRAAFVEDWHDDPVLVTLLADRVKEASGEVGGDPLVLVTAHSLPLRIIEGGDGYDVRLRETAELVAAAAGVTSWRVCWQSAGRTPEPWIGPDILDVLRELPAEGVGSVVVCPAGFTSDHLEVSYDLDIEAAGLARELGVEFARTRSLNADPALCDALAELVVAATP